MLHITARALPNPGSTAVCIRPIPRAICALTPPVIQYLMICGSQTLRCCNVILRCLNEVSENCSYREMEAAAAGGHREDPHRLGRTDLAAQIWLHRLGCTDLGAQIWMRGSPPLRSFFAYLPWGSSSEIPTTSLCFASPFATLMTRLGLYDSGPLRLAAG